MSDNRDNDALTALVTLAARLRDTASSVAERADAAARNAAGQATGDGEVDAGEDTGAERSAADSSNVWSSADFGALIDLAGVLRESVPADLRERLSGSLHDTLLSARALIDWYLERESAANAESGADPGNRSSDTSEGFSPENGGQPS